MFKKILFCTDFSEDSHWAFTYALDLAKTYKVNLLIFHVTPEPVHPEQLSLYLAPEKLEELKALQKKEINQQLKTHYVKKWGASRITKSSLKKGNLLSRSSRRLKRILLISL
jgi:nucleotide-binding universal stress UspA family protein